MEQGQGQLIVSVSSSSSSIDRKDAAAVRCLRSCTAPHLDMVVMLAGQRHGGNQRTAASTVAAGRLSVLPLWQTECWLPWKEREER